MIPSTRPQSRASAALSHWLGRDQAVQPEWPVCPTNASCQRAHKRAASPACLAIVGVYLTCYQVLEANHDPRAAEVLAAGQHNSIEAVRVMPATCGSP